MDKLISVQTLMFESELLKLKQLTDEPTTKGALRVAIDYYIETVIERG